jgi:hypothetical protein
MLRLACNAKPRHATPCPALPILTCDSLPRLAVPVPAVPFRATPRLRFHAMPEGNHAALASSLPAWIKA